MELRNCVGILTGASRGIGTYLADALARKGVNLALAARSKDDLEAVADKARGHGVRCIAIPTDVSDRAALEDLVNRTSSELGPIDLLVNNAGLELTGYFERLDPDEIDKVIRVNLTSVIQLTRLVLPEMVSRGKGHVCNIASAAGQVARPYATVYSATKHGVVGFSWSLRAEMAHFGVEVSTVCPAYVSEVGMWATRKEALAAGEPPRPLKPVTPQAVADATMRAIERNRDHVLVGPPLTKVAGVTHALSPDLAIAIGRRTGLHRYLKKEATGD